MQRNRKKFGFNANPTFPEILVKMLEFCGFGLLNSTLHNPVARSATVQGKNSKGPAMLNQPCSHFFLRIGGGPTGQTPTNNKMIAYPSHMLSLYEMGHEAKCPSFLRSDAGQEKKVL